MRVWGAFGFVGLRDLVLLPVALDGPRPELVVVPGGCLTRVGRALGVVLVRG